MRVGRDDDLEHAALDRGFQVLIELPAMVYEGATPKVRLPDRYSIDRVETNRTFATWSRPWPNPSNFRPR